MGELGLTWKRTNENNLYLNKVCLGKCFYSGFVSREDTRKFKVICNLPQVKNEGKGFETMEEAEKSLELAVLGWFKYCLGC